MAGERKGITYEAILKVVLDELKKKGAFQDEIFWNEKATGMSVTPDLTTGKSKDLPNRVLLVTHSNSAKNSDMKAWRNLGELAECKLRLKTIPFVFNVAFDSEIKDRLKAISCYSFDGQLIVGDRDYGRELLKWVENNQKSLPTEAMQKAAAISDLTKSDTSIRKLIEYLKKDVEQLFSLSNPHMSSVWKKERQRAAGKTTPSKTTFVRRGLSKLLIFEDIELGIRLYESKKVPLAEVPDYAFELGLARKTIGGATGTDVEIANAIQHVKTPEIRTIIKKFDAQKIIAWLTTLRNSPHTLFAGNYVSREAESLAKPNELFRRLKQLHLDPWALVDAKKAPENWPPHDIWLFSYLMELLKLSNAAANGFGYAQLAHQVTKYTGMPRANNRVYTIVLSDWLLRRGKEEMPDKVLKKICVVIAGMVKNERTKLKSTIEKIAKASTKNIIESKLCCYRSFDPIGCIAKRTQIPYLEKNYRSQLLL